MPSDDTVDGWFGHWDNLPEPAEDHPDPVVTYCEGILDGRDLRAMPWQDDYEVSDELRIHVPIQARAPKVTAA